MARLEEKCLSYFCEEEADDEDEDQKGEEQEERGGGYRPDDYVY